MGAGTKSESVMLHWHCGELTKDDVSKIVAGIQPTGGDIMAKRCCVPKYYFRRCLSGSTKENPMGADPSRWTCKGCSLVVCSRCL